MLNKLIEMRGPRLFKSSLVLFGLASFSALSTAQAQTSTVEPIIVESQSEDGTVSRFLGLAAGPSSVIVISTYGADTVEDADGVLTLTVDGRTLEGVELTEEFPSAIIQDGIRSTVLLLDLGLPEGTPDFAQSEQAEENLDVDNIVTVQTFRVAGTDQLRMVNAQQKTISDDGETFQLSGMTESSISVSLPYGGIVSDKCGTLTAFALPTDADGVTTLFPIKNLNGIYSGNSVASDFVVTEARCAQSTGTSKRVEIAEAALAEAERALREQQERDAELLAAAERERAALDALIAAEAREEDIATANARIDTILAQQQQNAELQEQVDTQLRESAELLEDAGDAVTEEQDIAEESVATLKLWTYILYGLGALTLIIIGVVIWLAVRSRRLRKNLAVVEDEKRDIEEAKAAAEATWHDCILENDQGLTTKLPGAKLVKSRGGVTIGRSREDADAVIDRDDVSRRHARFEVENDVVRLTDLGSTNKTRVNGGVLDQGVSRQIYEGDRIEFGVNAFTFKIVRR